MSTPRVDFSYAFGTPHRLTVARPDSGDKTILDVQASSLRMAWTYDSLVRFPLAVYASPQTNWDLRSSPKSTTNHSKHRDGRELMVVCLSSTTPTPIPEAAFGCRSPAPHPLPSRGSR